MLKLVDWPGGCGPPVQIKKSKRLRLVLSWFGTCSTARTMGVILPSVLKFRRLQWSRPRLPRRSRARGSELKLAIRRSECGKIRISKVKRAVRIAQIFSKRHRNQFQFVIYLRFLCITLLDSICIGNVSCRMQIIDVNRNFSLKCKKIRKHCFADLVLQL